jgi:hypothetical protein
MLDQNLSVAAKNHTFLHPTPIAAGVAHAYGIRIPVLYVGPEEGLVQEPARPNPGAQTKRQKKKQKKGKEFNMSQNWSDIDQFCDVVGQSIAQMASNINESVELVKCAGCTHPAEFNAAVTKTNEDFMMFASKYNAIKERHKNRSGVVTDPDDMAEWFSVFEDYRAFFVHFEGVMHHSLITFTEFALEAQDRLAAQQAAARDAAETVTDAEILSTEPTVQQ